MIGDVQCPECSTLRVTPSAVAGLAECQGCGNVFPIPDDLIELLYADDDSDEFEADETMMEIPDSVECAIGWRTWGIKLRRAPGEIPLMYSATHREAFWTPGQPMVATCEYGTGRANGVIRQGHEVPDEKCSCGLYSAKTYEHLMSMSYHRYNAEANGMFSVVGKVKLWGKVIEGNQGWRAQKGYPEELYLPFEAFADLGEALEEAYGCDVMMKNILGFEFEKGTKE